MVTFRLEKLQLCSSCTTAQRRGLSIDSALEITDVLCLLVCQMGKRMELLMEVGVTLVVHTNLSFQIIN